MLCHTSALFLAQSDKRCWFVVWHLRGLGLGLCTPVRYVARQWVRSAAAGRVCTARCCWCACGTIWTLCRRAVVIPWCWTCSQHFGLVCHSDSIAHVWVSSPAPRVCIMCASWIRIPSLHGRPECSSCACACACRCRHLQGIYHRVWFPCYLAYATTHLIIRTQIGWQPCVSTVTCRHTRIPNARVAANAVCCLHAVKLVVRAAFQGKFF